MEIIKDNYCRLAEVKKIPEEKMFLKIFTFLFETRYFSFKDYFYIQKIGCPMRGMVSPSIAEITMMYYVPNNIKCLAALITQYVNDIICAVPEDGVDTTNTTLQVFNSYNDKLQFTVEKETNNAVPFLDTKVIRTQKNIVVVDWYKKESNSSRVVPLTSNHPYKYKVSLIGALKTSIIGISLQNFIKENSGQPGQYAIQK